MASCTPRRNKAGEIISYQIKVTRGRDKLTGKQLTPFTTTYTPPEGWSRKAIERDLLRAMGEFEAACKRGEVLTKEQAKEQEQERLERDRQAQIEAERKPTFNAYAARFLKDKAVSLSPNTVKLYRHTLEQAGAVFGEQKMEDITTPAVKEYIIDLQQNGKNQKNGKPISHGTIQGRWVHLHTFFEAAVDDGIIPANPMQRMRYPKPRKDEAGKVVTAYDAEQVKYILQCASKEPLKWRAFITLALDSGCRKGELLGLKWSDIDFKTGRVTISRNVQYTSGSTGIYITTPKTGKARAITINPPALRVLAEWKREQRKAQAKQCIPIAGWVFTRDNGEVMPPVAPADYLRRFGKRYNLPGIHCHALRHTMASLAITNGADAVSVSEKLGHAKPSITLDVYSHANEESQKRANEILASVIYEQKQA